MAQETRDRLADQLSSLLSDVDAAIRAKFREPRRQTTSRRREAAAPDGEGVRGVLTVALRWFSGSTRRKPTP